MKVKDLIRQLKDLDPEATVIVTSDNFDLKYSKIVATYAIQSHEGSKETGTFIDAFDGESYDAETWSLIGGEEIVVEIW